MSKKIITKGQVFLIFVALLISVLPLIGSSFAGFYILNHENYFAQSSWSTLGVWVFVWAFAAAFACVNPTFLAVIYGYFIGFTAFPFLAAVNLLAIFIVYSFYRIGNFTFFEKLIDQNLRAKNLVEKLRIDEFKVIFFTKLSPVLPFTLTNICFAVSKSSLRNILLAGFLGMIPRTLLAIYTGMQAKALQEIVAGKKEAAWSDLFIVILFVISIIGIIFYFNKALKKTVI